MEPKLLMKYISFVLLLVLFVGIIFVTNKTTNVSPSKVVTNQSQKFVRALCSDDEYVSCLKITEVECSQSLYEAIRSCPTRVFDKTKPEVIDVPCSLEKFFRRLHITDELAMKCDVRMVDKQRKLEKELIERLGEPRNSD